MWLVGIKIVVKYSYIHYNENTISSVSENLIELCCEHEPDSASYKLQIII